MIILDLTRIETGQLKLTLEQVKIAIVCDRALEQVKALQLKSSPATTAELAQSSLDVRFTCFIEPGLETLVADDLRLRQMLVQLLANAFKFTEKGGEIGLRVSRWDGWIAFTVWDSGIGISEAQQHLIFQKFQQLENPLTRRFEGTGLGLVLTRALARMHGGDVSFISKEGQGSSFTILLPPNPPQKLGGLAPTKHWEHYPASIQLHSPPDNHHPRLVLIVEAVPRFIANISEKLTSLGYRVVIARSGTEALEKARRLQPKAIFINPMLPLLSGWDVLTLLKSDIATRQIPVIVTATRAEQERAFASKADEFLSLPVQSEVLPQILSRFFANAASPLDQELSTASDTPITILHLTQHQHSKVGNKADWLLTGLLNQHYYQVVAAEDLKQAELLARVWHPHVVLLQVDAEHTAYLQQLSKCSKLIKLPLVTLDAATTQAATQFPELSVFPCLTPIESLSAEELLPILRIAAGIEWKPNILVVDVTLLSDLTQVETDLGKHRSTCTESFQALIQYLQAAGFKSMIGHSWAEVLQQLRQQSVDLLLIYLGDTQVNQQMLAALKALAQQQTPPILVLDRRLSQAQLKQKCDGRYARSAYFVNAFAEHGRRAYRRWRSLSQRRHRTIKVSARNSAKTKTHTVLTADADNLESVLNAMALEILPPCLSMAELLNKIHHTLRNRE